MIGTRRKVRLDLPCRTLAEWEKGNGPAFGPSQIFVASHHPHPLGTPVALELVLANGEVAIRLTGHVAWRQLPGRTPPGQEPGMGVAVDELDPAYSALHRRMSLRAQREGNDPEPGSSFLPFKPRPRDSLLTRGLPSNAGWPSKSAGLSASEREVGVRFTVGKDGRMIGEEAEDLFRLVRPTAPDPIPDPPAVAAPHAETEAPRPPETESDPGKEPDLHDQPQTPTPALHEALGIGIPGGRVHHLFAVGTPLPVELSRELSVNVRGGVYDLHLYEGADSHIHGCSPLGFVRLNASHARDGSLKTHLKLNIDEAGMVDVTLSEVEGKAASQGRFFVKGHPEHGKGGATLQDGAGLLGRVKKILGT